MASAPSIHYSQFTTSLLVLRCVEVDLLVVEVGGEGDVRPADDEEVDGGEEHQHSAGVEHRGMYLAHRRHEEARHKEPHSYDQGDTVCPARRFLR